MISLENVLMSLFRPPLPQGHCQSPKIWAVLGSLKNVKETF